MSQFQYFTCGIVRRESTKARHRGFDKTGRSFLHMENRIRTEQRVKTEQAHVSPETGLSAANAGNPATIRDGDPAVDTTSQTFPT